MNELKSQLHDVSIAIRENVAVSYRNNRPRLLHSGAP